MALDRISRMILEELRNQENDSTIKWNQVMEWSSAEIKPEEGEKTLKLKELGLYVSYKPKKQKKNDIIQKS